jgi:hypothetical protein
MTNMTTITIMVMVTARIDTFTLLTARSSLGPPRPWV